MGCACKDKTQKLADKYGDGESIEVAPKNIFVKIMRCIFSFFMGIIYGVIIMFIAIFYLIYIVFNIIIGRKTSMRIPHVGKKEGETD